MPIQSVIDNGVNGLDSDPDMILFNPFIWIQIPINQKMSVNYDHPMDSTQNMAKIDREVTNHNKFMLDF